MITSMRIALVCGLAASICACAPPPKYAWGSYESSLYNYYKTPADKAAFMEHLADSISDAESSGKRVPPGLYAEYGNALLESGNAPQAIVYFQKEKQAWPESRVLMDTMMRVASAPKPAKP
jgi:hypothetical protein